MTPLFERHTVAIASGQSLSYLTAGTGPDVVLLHGTIVNACEMALSLQPLLSPTYRVTAFDRPGHGLSSRPRLRASLQDQAAAIAQGIAALGLHRPIVVGHSLGGALALTLALRHPESVHSVVAIAPIVFPEPRLEQLVFGARSVPGVGDVMARLGGMGVDASLLPILWRAMFLPQIMPPAFRDRFPFAEEQTGNALLITGEEAMQEAASLAADLALLRRWACPVRIFGGDRDLVVNNMVHGRMLATMLPDATFTLVPGAGHMLHHFEGARIAACVTALQG